MTVSDELREQAKVTELLDRKEIRYEIISGEIIISPSPSQLHQDIMFDLQLQARIQQFPVSADGSVEFPGCGDEYRPDIAIYRPGTELVSPGNRPGEKILLAIEIVSPSSRYTDEEVKKGVYAEVGIPSYLVIRQTGDLWSLYSAPEEGRYTACVEGPMGDYVHVPSLPWPVRTWSLDHYKQY
ncbi:Uma2 family endonuclease [Nocardiopsis chromatogenes]|uniref:Uma2 family endonuclease n=1 Tax=Nocardiopsis chromatogenes TaxID=280239 RepID=UPI00034D5707|nr:Uma2 family endonuclease [Nocardiopsis chromatogenes]